MKYKTSFFSKYIILEDLKKYWGLSALYFFISLITGPLEIMFSLSNPYGVDEYKIERILRVAGDEMQFILSICFPILLSVLIYRYLQQNKSTTFMHSLPVTRKELIHSHNIAGFLLIFVPILLNTIILLIASMTYSGDNSIVLEVFTVTNIFKWMGLVTTINLAVYLVSSTVAMISGMSLVQGILTIIFLLLPQGLGTLMIINFQQLIYGFTINRFSFDKIMTRISPLTALISSEPISTNVIIWYIILGAILYFVSYYLYNRRHLESASDTIAFNMMKPIFKYGVTFCTMVLIGVYFNSLMKSNLWLYIGYAIGGFLGYIIAEMIIKKSIWIFKNMKGFVIYSVIIVIAFIGIKFDIIGYEARIPDTQDIQSVYYGRILYAVENEDPKNIENVRALHKQLLENRDRLMNIEDSRYTGEISVLYKLKNGRTMARRYAVPDEFIESNQHIKEIYESREYKVKYNTIFHLDLDKLSYIDVTYDDSGKSERIKIIDKKKVNEVISVIKADILHETYEEIRDNDNRLGYINIYYDNDTDNETYENNTSTKVDNSIYLRWKKSYDGLTKWLKDNGYYE